MSARLDRINQGYQEQQNIANYWAGKNAQKQHEAHKVMQDLVRLRNEEVARMNAARAPAPQPHHHPPPPAPSPPPPKKTQKQNQVKVSNVNVVNLTYGQTPVEQMEKLYFQDVGGTEILSVARHDTVGGEPVIHSPVENLQDLSIQFNSLNILMSTKLDTLFAGYGIDINEKIDRNATTVSVEEDTGNMVIEVQDVNKDEYVQIQVASRVEEFGLGANPVWYNDIEDENDYNPR
jgi:hypothetical protein